MSIPRAPWSLDFPSVVVHTTVAARDGHVDYQAAKSGDADAAFRVVHDLMSPSATERIKDALAGRRPIIVPVHAIETTGINFLPEALGRDLGEYLSLPVTAELVQTNTVGHTRASGFHRLAFQPTFEGSALAGQEYLLVDDHVGLGGTLANLRGHIENQGGRVILATTLTASRRSEIQRDTCAQPRDATSSTGEAWQRPRRVLATTVRLWTRRTQRSRGGLSPQDPEL
jgi:hypothetical protein